MSLIEPGKITLRQIAAVVVILIVLAAVGYHFWTKNALQEQIQVEKQARSDEQQGDIDEQKTEVNTSANIANQAKANTAQIENANFSNTNLKRANDLRCKAFPDSRGCQ